MFKSYRAGSVFGIPIELDVTVLFVVPVFAWLIGTQLTETIEVLNRALDAGIAVEPLAAGYWPWILGLVTAVGLFVGVVLHELGHSLVAIRYGYEIDSITLWIFGGLANLVDQPEDWRHEFRIAIAGPVVSVAVGAVAYALLLVTPPGADAAGFVFGFLAAMNVALAGFNMVPAFPMDGGRVLRAILGRNRSFAVATRQAAEVGKFSAIALGLFGLFVGNVFLIGIAFFVYIAAGSESRRTAIRAALEDVPVAQLMTPAGDLRVVSPDTTVERLLERMFRERHTGYPVLEDGELVGIVTLEDVQAVEPDDRWNRRVEEIMTRDVRTVAPDGDASEAFATLSQNDIGRLLVTDERGRLRGLISRTDVMTALKVLERSGSEHPVRTSTGPGDRERDRQPAEFRR